MTQRDADLQAIECLLDPHGAGEPPRLVKLLERLRADAARGSRTARRLLDENEATMVRLLRAKRGDA